MYRMINGVVKSCLQNGFLIEPELVNILSDVPCFDAEVNDFLINLLCSINEGRMLSIDGVSKNVEKINSQFLLRRIC